MHGGKKTKSKNFTRVGERNKHWALSRIYCNVKTPFKKGWIKEVNRKGCLHSSHLCSSVNYYSTYCHTYTLTLHSYLPIPSHPPSQRFFYQVHKQSQLLIVWCSFSDEQTSSWRLSPVRGCFTKYIYIEYHSVCPLVGVGTPLSPASVPLPPEPKGGGHTRLRVRGWGSPSSDDWRKSWAFCLLCGLLSHCLQVMIWHSFCLVWAIPQEAFNGQSH